MSSFESEFAVTNAAVPTDTGHITGKLSTLDRRLVFWALAAMALGLGRGWLIRTP